MQILWAKNYLREMGVDEALVVNHSGEEAQDVEAVEETETGLAPLKGIRT